MFDFVERHCGRVLSGGWLEVKGDLMGNCGGILRVDEQAARFLVAYVSGRGSPRSKH